MSGYDAWRTGDIGASVTGPRSPAYDSRRDEWISERAAELVEEWMGAIDEIADEVSWIDDAEYKLPDIIAQFLIDYREADSLAEMAEIASAFHGELSKMIESSMRERALDKAEAEADE